eukprot:TRINITY_DN2590_c0_g1_i1.p1 TRINITY_DN2590_c0_g1~~TRINITY_DN2590_c0_g1_i1.p1  ORF type:complete len:383 (+),score=107.59 TRINITY_DN2590_c0_g1_i1:1246-2394(+)
MNDENHQRFLKALRASTGLKAIMKRSEKNEKVDYNATLNDFNISNDNNLFISTKYTKENQFKRGVDCENLCFNRELLSFSFEVESKIKNYSSPSKNSNQIETDYDISANFDNYSPLVPFETKCNKEAGPELLSSPYDSSKPMKKTQFKPSELTTYKEALYSNVPKHTKNTNNITNIPNIPTSEQIIEKSSTNNADFENACDEHSQSEFSETSTTTATTTRSRSNSQTQDKVITAFQMSKKHEPKSRRLFLNHKASKRPNSKLSSFTNKNAKIIMETYQPFAKFGREIIKDVDDVSNILKKSSNSEINRNKQKKIENPKIEKKSPGFDSFSAFDIPADLHFNKKKTIPSKIVKIGEPLEKNSSLRNYYVKNYNYEKYQLNVDK